LSRGEGGRLAVPLVSAKRIVLSLLWELSVNSGAQTRFSISEIRSRIDPCPFGLGYTKRILEFLMMDGSIDCLDELIFRPKIYDLDRTDILSETPLFNLSEKGFKKAEKLPNISRMIVGMPLEMPTNNTPDDLLERPQDHTLIRLNPNHPVYLEIGFCLRSLKDQIRGVNDDDASPLEKDNISRRVDEAIEIWDSAEFTWETLKIGVIITIEDAQSFLGRLVKSVGEKILVDMIKEFVLGFLVR
jgi:hypothetical protein